MPAADKGNDDEDGDDDIMTWLIWTRKVYDSCLEAQWTTCLTLCHPKSKRAGERERLLGIWGEREKKK